MTTIRVLATGVVLVVTASFAGGFVPPAGILPGGSAVQGAAAQPAASPATPTFIVSGMSRNPPADLTVSCYVSDFSRITKPVAEVVRVREGATGPAPRVATIALEESSSPGRDGKPSYRYSGALKPAEINARYRFRCGGNATWSGWDEYATPHVKQIYPPSPMPDRIILTWTGDPTTSQAVTWRTDTTVKTPFVEVGLSGPNYDFTSHVRRVAPATVTLTTPEHSNVLYHSATMSGLEPETLYAYRVGADNGLWSEWFQFRTASKEPKPFSFLYVGDAQHQIRDFFSRELRQAHRDAPDARFIVHAGDLVTTGFSDQQWGEWHYAGGWLNAMLPSVPAVGNHEYYGGAEGTKLTPHWRAQYALPEHGPKGLEEQDYYIDYQGVRMICLNSVDAEAKPSATGPDTTAAVQAKWLEDVLRTNRNKWTMVAFHYPVFSAWSPERENQMQKYWKPVFDKYGVDLVLQGHEHLYGRLRVAEGELPAKNAPGAERRFDATRGTVYVTSVGVATLLKMDPTARDLMMRTGENLQLYQIISIDGDMLRYQAKTVTGRVYDAFDLEKQGPGRANRLTERPKDMQPHYFETAAPLQGTPFTLAPETLDRYVGTFARTDYGRTGYTVARRGNSLTLTALGQEARVAELTPASATEFAGSLDGKPLRVVFNLDDTGRAFRLRLAGTTTVLDRQADRAEPAPAAGRSGSR